MSINGTICSRVFLSLNRKENLVICDNMESPQGHLLNKTNQIQKGKYCSFMCPFKCDTVLSCW